LNRRRTAEGQARVGPAETMAGTPSMELTERDLSRWKLVGEFQDRLRKARRGMPLDPTWTHPERQLQLEDYLSLYLLGLLNPVVRTMRGLCEASRLKRVQEEVCFRPVSLGSFSEAQAVLDPALLLQLYTGQAPTRRMMELIQFYLLGVATLDELEKGLERERQRVARRKKS
jgi:hypothetical protein